MPADPSAGSVLILAMLAMAPCVSAQTARARSAEWSEVAAADVVELPFRSATFDAVAHADVFC